MEKRPASTQDATNRRTYHIRWSISSSKRDFCLIFYLKKARENVYILLYKHPAHVPVYVVQKNGRVVLNMRGMIAAKCIFMTQNVLEYILQFNKERGRGLLSVLLHQCVPKSGMTLSFFCC